jgi:hypothetical protein
VSRLAGAALAALAALAACKRDPAPAPAPTPAPAPAPTPAPSPTPAPTAANPLAVTELTGKPLPAGVIARGAHVDRALTFTDKNGANYVVFSSTDSEHARALFIDHWVVPAAGAPRSLLPARDFVNDCVMGALLAKIVDGAVGVTDLDHDGIAELTYGYQLACRSDVSTATYKLLLVEDGVKYILRGHSRMKIDDSIAGGEFVAEPAPATWPAGFYDHAAALWSRTADDLEGASRP